MSSQDTVHINNCVTKQADDYYLAGDELYQVQFTKLVETQEGKKYIRATINAGHSQVMEIWEKYGLNDKIANRWQIWQPGQDGKKGKNVKYNKE